MRVSKTPKSIGSLTFLRSMSFHVMATRMVNPMSPSSLLCSRLPTSRICAPLFGVSMLLSCIIILRSGILRARFG